MIRFKKVVIIGTGLIGGSLGLALKRQRLAGQIIGFSRQPKNARLAQKLGAIDQIGKSLAEVEDADLVILATPVETIMELAGKIAQRIKPDCLVIDVGSSKERIVSKLSALIPNFLGCHPLSGSEKKGVANLEGSIFKGAICVLTPTTKTNPQTLDKIKWLWKKIGARVVILSAKKHDQLLGFTSHLPHAVAFSLMRSIPEQGLALTASGLRDSTRISSSDEHLWSEIFLSNRDNLLKALAIFQSNLSALKLALKSKDKIRLRKFILSANQKRNMLLRLSR